MPPVEHRHGIECIDRIEAVKELPESTAGRSGIRLPATIQAMPPNSRRFHLPLVFATLASGAFALFLWLGLGNDGAIGHPSDIASVADAGAAVSPAVPGATGIPGGSTATPPATIHAIDTERLLLDLSILAHDSMEGRRTATPGIQRARAFLLEEFEGLALTPTDDGYELPFTFQSTAGGEVVSGVNLVGFVEGSEFPERFLVVSAHYDHLGVRGNEIYNGADDNASGTAALLALARHFGEQPPRHSILLAAFDAEEMGLRGARAFVASPPIPLSSIVMNINLDMVSRSEVGELYAAGTHHYPFLAPLVDEVAAVAPVTLLRGHDTPDLPPGDDWTMASDHAAFHEVGIPFTYFGVEDHAGYHDPSDTFENITPEFYGDAVTTILTFLRRVDDQGTLILEASGRAP